MIRMTLLTPTGIKFEVEIDPVKQKLFIITSKQNRHEYKFGALKDLYVWLRHDCAGNWVYLGSKGEEEIPKQGTIEEWARSEANPVGGFFGITPGRRGRFASYVPSILEALGFLEVEHKLKNNRARAL